MRSVLSLPPLLTYHAVATMSSGAHTLAQSPSNRVPRPYSVSPLPLCGVEVRGIDLKAKVDPKTIAMIKEDVALYRLMVFRGQGIVSGERHVEISHWFGELDCPFYKHPSSPHPEVRLVASIVCCSIKTLSQG